MLTVSKTSDDDTYQAYTLGVVPATVYVRVTDDNRVSGNRSADSIRVDHMFFGEGIPNTDPPDVASGPSPGNGASNVSVSTNLSWTAGSNATSHDVYFGTTIVPPLIGNQTGTSYDPGQLIENTTYYWLVVERNANGTSTGNSTWSFTTAAAQQCSLLPVGASCIDNSECCSNKCKGRNGAKTCK